VAGELEALQAQRLGLSQRAAMMAETQREFEAVAHMLYPLGEHLGHPLERPAAYRARRVQLHEPLRTRPTRAQVHARQHDVVLGRVHAHHAQRLLRTRVGGGRPEARPAENAPAAASARPSAVSACRSASSV
jgi:hypothetical protein